MVKKVPPSRRSTTAIRLQDVTERHQKGHMTTAQQGGYLVGPAAGRSLSGDRGSVTPS